LTRIESKAFSFSSLDFQDKVREAGFQWSPVLFIVRPRPVETVVTTPSLAVVIGFSDGFKVRVTSPFLGREV
jgi:hypothetical protein